MIIGACYYDCRLIPIGERFFGHNLQTFGSDWRCVLVSIYGGVLSLLVKLSRSKKKTSSLHFTHLERRKSGKHGKIEKLLLKNKHWKEKKNSPIRMAFYSLFVKLSFFFSLRVTRRHSCFVRWVSGVSWRPRHETDNNRRYSRLGMPCVPLPCRALPSPCVGRWLRCCRAYVGLSFVCLFLVLLSPEVSMSMCRWACSWFAGASRCVAWLDMCYQYLAVQSVRRCSVPGTRQYGIFFCDSLVCGISPKSRRFVKIGSWFQHRLMFFLV